MVAVPILVFHDIVDVVLIIGSETESAELTLALVVDALLLLLTHVQALIEVGEKSLKVSSELLLAVRVEHVGIDVKLLQPRHQMLIILLKSRHVEILSPRLVGRLSF